MANQPAQAARRGGRAKKPRWLPLAASLGIALAAPVLFHLLVPALMPWSALPLTMLIAITSSALGAWCIQRTRPVGPNAEEAVRRLVGEEDPYRALLDNLPQRIFLKDRDLVYVACNARYAGDLGIQPEDIAGTTAHDYFPPDDAAKYGEDDRRVLEAGETQTVDDNYVYLGQEGTVHVVRTPLRDETGAITGILGIFWDVTRQRAAEEALKESERNLRELFHHMIEGVALHELIYDDAGNPVDYEIFGANPKYAEHTGIPLEQALGKRASEVYGMGEPPFLDIFSRVAETGEPHRFEVHFAPLERHFRISVFAPSKGKFATIFEDITERKELESIRRASEATARALLNASPANALLVALDGTVLGLNDRAAAAFGATPEDIVGQCVYGLLAPDLAASRRARLDEVAASGEACRFEDSRAGRIYENTVVPVLDDEGRTRQLAIHALDVTEARRAEEHRLALERQMQHTQKLESLGVMAGGIAHDFNNLLMGVLGHADLALDTLPAGSEARKDIAEVQTAAKRAADLARQMLAYSGKGLFVLKAIDLNTLVKEMGHLLSVSISKKALLRYDLAGGLPSFRGDATQIGQVVMNLVINGAEALQDETGVVSITTRAVECDPSTMTTSFLADGLNAGQYVSLEISDTGCGMDVQTQERIFDPFFTTKFTGRGLGMAAVLGIVRAHQGAIKVYSEPGKGTTFRILLPACDAAETENAAKTSESASHGGESHGTVLLVDDDPMVLRVGSRMLERAGYAVLTARDGREAVDTYAARQDEIRCILLDLTMPNMDGEEAFRHLRQIDPHVKVLICSGYNEHEATRRFAGKGLAGFLQKPYQLDALAKQLRACLG